MNDFQFIFGTAGSIVYIYDVLSIMADNAIWWCFPCASTILRIKLVLNIDKLNFHYGISDETLEKCVIIWVKFFKLFYQKTLHIYVNTNIVSYSQCSLCRQCLCFFLHWHRCMYRDRVLVFNVTFNSIAVNISWTAILVEETGVPGEKHRPDASHWQTLST